MKKRISYLIILFIFMFFGISKVEAASELLCLYQAKNDSNYKYYLYQADDVKPYVVLMRKSGNNYYAYGEIKLKIKKGNLDDNGYLSGCPKSADVSVTTSKVTIKKDADLTATNHVSTYASKGYTAWSCNYAVTDSISLNVEQNKYGLITFSYTEDDKSYDGKKLFINDYTFGSNTCPTYLKSKTYDVDNEATFYYELPKNITENDCAKCSGSGCSLDSNSSVVSGEEKCSTDGKNCEYADEINEDKFCVYENVGACSPICNGDYCLDSNSDECKAIATGDEANKKYKTSSYMLLTYNNGLYNRIYLPKSGYSATDIADRIYDYRYNGAEASYLADIFNSYSATDIAVSQYWNDDNNEQHNDNSQAIKYCPKWLIGSDGLNAYEYTQESFFWKRIDVQLEDLDDDHSDVADGYVDRDEFEGDSGGPFLCKYNDGNMVMQVRYGDYTTKINVYFPNDTDFGSAYFKYKFGEGTDEPISWISKSGKYGKVESANDGSFENYLSSSCSCPEKIMYDLTDGSLTICHSMEDCDDSNAPDGDYVVGLGYDNNCSTGELDSDDDGESVVNCDNLISSDLRKTLNEYFLLFRIIVPILVIVLGIVDFAKAIFASKEDDMKKTQTSFIKRIIIAVVIFLIPTFVNLLLDIADTVWGWNSSGCVEKITTNEID